MNGLGGLNKSENGVVLGLVQLQLPVIKSSTDLKTQAKRIAEMVAKAKRGMPTLDLLVFPEYSLQGMSMNTDPDVLSTMDGPEGRRFQAGLHRQ